MTRFEIDPATASITFDATTSLHGVAARAPLGGWFEAELIDGRFAPGSALSGEIQVAVDAISSGNPLYDAETRRRIDVDAHPVITGKITKTNSIEGDTATIEGAVSFHGDAVLLEGELKLLPGPVLIGEGTIDIRWWGLQPPRLLAFRVQPEVVVGIEAPLAK
jgi:polyisoprenoid-binding protein YceI